MRTITNGTAALPVDNIKVEVYNGSSWIDLCAPTGTSFPGKSRVKSLVIQGSRDTGMYRASLTIINNQAFRAANESLDPGHTSIFNVDGVPLLGAYHEVRISLGKDTAPVLMFNGYIGPGDIQSGEDVEDGDVITVECVGKMQRYADDWIDRDEGRTYRETYISASTNMLNQILADYGYSQDIVVADDPSYYIHEYRIGDISLLDALKRPVEGIGYCLEERYYAAADEFRPTIVDPLRSNTTADLNLAGNIRAVRLTYSEANIRTKVRVVYRDRTTGKEASVLATDTAARDKYGIPTGTGTRRHRYMRIVEKDQSCIDTRAEAQDEADAALHDLSAPCPAVEIQIPWIVQNIELGDLVQVETPSETLKVGVTEIEMRLPEFNRVGETILRGALNRRIGARRYWFLRGRTDWVGKHDRDYDESHGPLPPAPTYVEALGQWGEDESGSPAPILHVRWHGNRAWNLKGYRVRYAQAELEDSGTATGGSTTTLEDTSKSWNESELAGKYLVLETTTRTQADRVRKIKGNTTTSVTLESAFDTAVAAGENYKILSPTTDWTVVATDVYPYVQIKGLPEGAYVIAQVAAVPASTGR